MNLHIIYDHILLYNLKILIHLMGNDSEGNMDVFPLTNNIVEKLFFAVKRELYESHSSSHNCHPHYVLFYRFSG